MKKYRGLTLIEVLIASLILFTALGLVATVFQYNLHNQSRLFRQLDTLDGLSSVQSQISYAIQNGEREGEFMVDGKDIAWKASVLNARPPITSFDFENNRQGTSADIMQLLQVEVTLSHASLPVTYKEVVWQNNAG